MPLNHLNDDEIQDYLEGDGGQRIKNHLDRCEICRETLAQYENIRERLKSDSPFELPRNFSEKVMRQLEGEKAGESSSVLSAVLALLGAIGFGVVLFFFNGLKVLQDAAGDFVGVLQSMADALNGGLVLMAGAAAILLLLALVDKGIHRARQKTS